MENILLSNNNPFHQQHQQSVINEIYNNITQNDEHQYKI